MTTPLDPRAPRAPRATTARVRAGGATGPLAGGALLGLLVLAVIVASSVRAVPAGPLIALGVLLLAAFVLLCVEGPPARDRAMAPARPCGLEDTSDTLRCGLPAGHTGVHLDIPSARAFAQTLDADIGDAGAYYRDGQGRATPVDDVF